MTLIFELNLVNIIIYVLIGTAITILCILIMKKLNVYNDYFIFPAIGITFGWLIAVPLYLTITFIYWFSTKITQKDY